LPGDLPETVKVRVVAEVVAAEETEAVETEA
jgi:hypothetical protein